MSLIGSLEDLGLADILQIVSLARKSGLLLLRSDRGEGRIVFEAGLVRAAYAKGQPESLSALLVATGLASAEAVEAAIESARESGQPRDEAVASCVDLAPERLDALRREHVESVVLEMFGWQVGEFRFDVRDGADLLDEELVLPTGVNAQYLTMEATRLCDEGGGSDDADLLLSGEAAAEPLFAARDSADALALAAASRGEEPAPEVCPATETPAPAPVRSRPLIAIDPDLRALEWLKAQLAGCFARIHIFPHCGDGVGRIRQYLARGELPVVLVSSRAPADPLSGAVDGAELVARLRAQAPRLPIVVLREEGEEPGPGFEVADGVAVRPPSAALGDRRRRALVERCGVALRESLSAWGGPPEASEP